MAELVIDSLAGPAHVQDGGRPGYMHEGVPPGGALVPELLAAANLSLGNEPGAPALECFAGLALRAEADLALSVDGAPAALRAGETLRIDHPRLHRVRYVAFRGGLDVPRRLGGRGTLAVAALGGHEGRWLRRGDRLRVRGGAATPVAAVEARLGDGPIRVIPGPDVEAFAPGALAILLDTTWLVSPQSDRIGTRLAGPALPRTGDDAGESRPMVAGAIQVPLAGAPIVLGPDHPTTGGYPVLATVVRADLGRVGAARPGASLRFVPG